MSVEDHGLEGIRKSARQVVPGDKTEYELRTYSPELSSILDDILDALGGPSGGATQYQEGNTTDPATGNAILIRNLLGELVVPSAADPMPVDIQDVSVDVNQSPIEGTEDGTLTGTKRVFVNNLRQMIMASQDRVSQITWLDINSKKNRRVDKIEYTSATFPGVIIRKQFSYSLIGNEYILDDAGIFSVV